MRCTVLCSQKVVAAWSLLYWIMPAYSSQILGVFTMAGMSHFNYHMAMMKALLSAGHQVTIISPYTPQHTHSNLTVISSFDKNRKRIEAPPLGGMFWITGSLHLINILEEDCYYVMSPEKIKVLQNFDVMFVESFHMYQCYFPLAKILKIPIIGTFSSRTHVEGDFSVGNTRISSTFPVETTFISSSRMTFLQKVHNVFRELELRMATVLKNWKLKMFYEKHFPEGNPRDFVVSLLFANNHAIFFPRPISSNTINIGGIHIKSTALGPLTEELRKFIEEASKGVILFSLGTIFTSKKLDAKMKNTLRNTFSKIPQRIIFTFDGEIENIPDNVLLSKWVPQKEILAHKNVVAFISHCGMSSTYEAIYFGKPMVLVPIFGDQPGTARDLNNLGVGVYINIVELNEQNLLEAINEVVNNTKYRQNMEKLSLKFKDEPISPSELVVYWTEHVIKNKGAHYLRSVDADMSLYQYFLVDVIACLIVIIVLAGLFIFLTIKYLFFHHL